MAYFSTLLLSMFITIGLVPIISGLAAKFQLVDVPDERKMHTIPVPRVGGVAMAIGMLVPVLAQHPFDRFSTSLLLGTAILVGFALADDFTELGYRAKFLGQILAALVVILVGDLRITNLGIVPHSLLALPWVSIPLTLLCIVAVTNAVNLADGLDGLAAGLMLQAFICLGLIGYRCGNTFTTLLAIAVVGAIFGFLRFNTHPATIFMGDTGSQLLGYLAIVLTLNLSQHSPALSPLLPLLLLGFPVIDMAVVMGERLRRGVSPFKADKSHFHHKLIQMGLYHSEVVFVVYAIQLLFVSSAYLLRFQQDWLVMSGFVAIMSVSLVPIYTTYGTGFRPRSIALIDRWLNTGFRESLKESHVMLKLSQATVENGLPILLAFTAFVPASVSPWLRLISAVFLCVLLLATLVKASWTTAAIKTVIYLVLPLVFLHSQQQVAPWIHGPIFVLYTFSYGLIAFAGILLLKLTRRRKGFRPTPTDFLIVLIALIVPNLPDPAIESLRIGLWSAFMIVIFFGIELLIGEMRGEVRKLGISVLPALVILIARGLLI